MKIEILTTPNCSKCEKAKKVIEKVTSNAGVEVKEVDLLKHPELAVKHNILSAPAILINGKLEFAGIPNAEELKDKIIKGL